MSGATAFDLLSWVDVLACPDCEGSLEIGVDDVSCVACGFSSRRQTPLDLRPRARRARRFTVSAPGVGAGIVERCTIGPPPAAYSGPRGARDASGLFSAVIERCRPGTRLLDLGCGPRDQAAPAAHLGLRYIGVDVDSPRADLLADAHAVPFRPGSFELVLSYAVLEHLANPFVAVAEVARVLAPGGACFGAVAQGEPFHASYFHHTAWGLAEVLDAAGLELTRLWPSYDTLRALGTMGGYPRFWRLALRALDGVVAATPFLAPRRHFRGSAREKVLASVYRAASLCFVAVKRR